jgi:hypothetical protein
MHENDYCFKLTNETYLMVDYLKNEVKLYHLDQFLKTYRYESSIVIGDVEKLKERVKNDIKIEIQ